MTARALRPEVLFAAALAVVVGAVVARDATPGHVGFFVLVAVAALGALPVVSTLGLVPARTKLFSIAAALVGFMAGIGFELVLA